MRVLFGFERSGKGREAFRAMGHEAWSCDLEPADDGSPFHLQCDIFEAAGWDLRVPSQRREFHGGIPVLSLVCYYEAGPLRLP